MDSAGPFATKFTRAAFSKWRRVKSNFLINNVKQVTPADSSGFGA
jgi:hypothetical protein